MCVCVCVCVCLCVCVLVVYVWRVLRKKVEELAGQVGASQRRLEDLERQTEAAGGGGGACDRSDRYCV